MRFMFSTVRRRMSVSLLGTFAAVGLLVGFSGVFHQSVLADDGEGGVVERSLSVTIELEFGEVLQLDLVDADFASPDFDGTITFSGTVTDADGNTIPTTVTTSVEHIQQHAPIWQNLTGEELVFSVSSGGTAANLHLVEAGDAVSVSTTIEPIVSGITGAVSVHGEFVDLQDSLDGLATSRSELAVLAGNYLGSILVGIVDDEFQVVVPVPYTECLRSARDTCERSCGTNQPKHPCVKSVNWTPEGGCSFVCMTLAECCEM